MPNIVTEPTTTILESFFTKKQLEEIRRVKEYPVTDYLESHGIPIVRKRREYESLRKLSNERPQILLHYCSAIEKHMNLAEWFVTYNPVGIEKYALADDSLDFYSLLHKMGRDGYKDVLILHKELLGAVNHEELSKWHEDFRSNRPSTIEWYDSSIPSMRRE